MATAQHTPHGRGYEQSLLYFHHCVDYWTQTPSIGCPVVLPPTATITTVPAVAAAAMVPIVDLWDGDRPSVQNGSSSCGTVTQPLSTCDCSSCSHCKNASDYADGVGRALLGPFNGTRYVDDTFADRVISAVQSHDTRAADKPLFVFWATHAAHTPLQVPQASVDRFASIANPWRRTYTAMVWHAGKFPCTVHAICAHTNAQMHKMHTMSTSIPVLTHQCICCCVYVQTSTSGGCEQRWKIITGCGTTRCSSLHPTMVDRCTTTAHREQVTTH